MCSLLIEAISPSCIEDYLLSIIATCDVLQTFSSMFYKIQTIDRYFPLWIVFSSKITSLIGCVHTNVGNDVVIVGVVVVL